MAIKRPLLFLKKCARHTCFNIIIVDELLCPFSQIDYTIVLLLAFPLLLFLLLLLILFIIIIIIILFVFSVSRAQCGIVLRHRILTCMLALQAATALARKGPRLISRF